MMRNVGPRPELPDKTRAKLADKTDEIEGESAANRAKRAAVLYKAAREAPWFTPVVQALRSMAGHGECCMYCSGNEASEVEHYRPKDHFPERTFEYANYLWTCHACNHHKQNRFPPRTEEGAEIVNPVDDNVWEFFFVDEKFGRLIGRIDPHTGEPSGRAQSTFTVVRVDRQAMQDRRRAALRSLRMEVERALDEVKDGSLNDAVSRLQELRRSALQPDVADYFLNGPGRSCEPFRSLLLAAGEPVVD